MTDTRPLHGPHTRCQLTLTGEIDLANADDYLALAQAIIAGHRGATCFAVDLSGVTFMDSTGVGMLVNIHKATTDAGMELRLDGVSSRVRRLLEITGLDDHFGVDRP